MTGMSTLPEPERTRISISNFWIRTHRILNNTDNFLISFLVIGHKTWYCNGTHSSYFRTGIASSNVYLSITDHVLAVNPCCFDQLKKTFFVTFITKKFLKIRWYCNFSFFYQKFIWFLSLFSLKEFYGDILVSVTCNINIVVMFQNVLQKFDANCLKVPETFTVLGITAAKSKMNTFSNLRLDGAVTTGGRT